MRVWCCGLVVGAGVLLGACAGGGSGTGQVLPGTTTKAPATSPLKTATSSPPETPATTTTRLTPETTRTTAHRSTTTAKRPTTPRRTPPPTRRR
ncbi:hypothetical protein [Amycolatopsis sp. lyj-90]|uniref:hypothetical protein n=1 Tax=Amycolatopsis sp. lyj-90 TaxID=2789285 RepID=UPI00397CC8F5